MGWTDRDGGTDSCETRNHVLDGVHIGATWRIRLNNMCSAAMRAVATCTHCTNLCCIRNSVSVNSNNLRINGTLLCFICRFGMTDNSRNKERAQSIYTDFWQLSPSSSPSSFNTHEAAQQYWKVLNKIYTAINYIMSPR